MDLFAGTGALALEALSRGANHVTAIEKSKLVFQSLQKMAFKLEADNLRIINEDALFWLKDSHLGSEITPNYDLIFIDPPFASGLLEPAAKLLESNNFISSKTLIYIEQSSEKESKQLPSNWKRIKHKISGEVDYALYHL